MLMKQNVNNDVTKDSPIISSLIRTLKINIFISYDYQRILTCCIAEVERYYTELLSWFLYRYTSPLDPVPIGKYFITNYGRKLAVSVYVDAF